MLIALEIGLAIFGIVALVRGKFKISNSKEVRGVPAYLLGILALDPLPLLLLVGVAYGLIKKTADIPDKDKVILTGIELAVVLGVAIIVFGVGAAIGTEPEVKRRKKRRRDDDEDEENDRPWRKGLNEDDEEEQPRRKRRAAEDDEEEQPRRKRKEYDDEEEPPRRQRIDDDEDDEEPRKRRRLR